LIDDFEEEVYDPDDDPWVGGAKDDFDEDDLGSGIDGFGLDSEADMEDVLDVRGGDTGGTASLPAGAGGHGCRLRPRMRLQVFTDSAELSSQRDLFSRHLDGDRLAAARAELEARGIARTFVVETAGRPRLVTPLASISPEEDGGLWSLPSPVSSPASVVADHGVCKGRDEALQP